MKMEYEFNFKLLGLEFFSDLKIYLHIYGLGCEIGWSCDRYWIEFNFLCLNFRIAISKIIGLDSPWHRKALIKLYITEHLQQNYNYTFYEAWEAIENSILLRFLDNNLDFVEHDGIEYWAKIIHENK